MPELIISIVITAVVLLSISIYFTIKKSPLRYIVPIIALLISLVLIGLSFIIGSWEAAFGFAVFIGSAIAFIITAIIASMIELKKTVR